MAERAVRVLRGSLSDLSTLASGKGVPAITGISQAATAVVTCGAGHDFRIGDLIVIEDVVGMVEVNDRLFTIGPTSFAPTTFSLLGINSTAYTAWSSGGTVRRAPVVSSADPSLDAVSIHYEDALETQQIIEAINRARDKILEELS